VTKETLVQPACKVKREFKEQLGSLAYLASQDLLDRRASLVPRVKLDLLVLLVSRDNKVKRDKKDQLETLETQVPLAVQVLLGFPEALVPRVSKVLWVLLELLEVLV